MRALQPQAFAGYSEDCEKAYTTALGQKMPFPDGYSSASDLNLSLIRASVAGNLHGFVFSVGHLVICDDTCCLAPQKGAALFDSCLA